MGRKENEAIIKVRDYSNMTINDLNTESKKSLHKGRASQVFKAQEKNKRNVCQAVSNNKQGSDAEDRDKLIRKYAYLVKWVVGRLPAANLKGVDRDDLVGYGTIGLIEAVDRFDTSRNTSFESYAITRIRGSIYDQLRAADWLTRGARKRVKNLYKATSTLEHKLGRYPTNKEIADELSINAEELRVVQQEAQIGIFSLDEPKDNYSDDCTTTVVDNVSSGEATALENLEENELKNQLAKAIDALPEREKAVIGLYHYKRLTFKEIATVMDFSESRASQIHARALSLLKSKLIKE